jgi:hypothetical protein
MRKGNAVYFGNGVEWSGGRLFWIKKILVPFEFFTVVALLLLAGCHGDAITPGLQDVDIGIYYHGTTKGISKATVTARFPAEEGLTRLTKDMLEQSTLTNWNNTITNSDGNGVVSVMISGPMRSLGPDQITNGPIAFRIHIGKSIIFLWSGGVHAGDLIKADSIDLRINSIGKPYGR